MGNWYLFQIQFFCNSKEITKSLISSPRGTVLLKAMKKPMNGVPEWLSWLIIRFRLRPWSWGLRVPAPRQALCWQLRAWSLPHVMCLHLSLTLSCSCSVSLSLSKIVTLKKKKACDSQNHWSLVLVQSWHCWSALSAPWCLPWVLCSLKEDCNPPSSLSMLI